MIIQAWSVYDNALGAFMQPQFFQSRGQAIRAFTDAVQSEGSQFSKHSGDYHFFYLGDFDDNRGEFIDPAKGVPERVISAQDCLREVPPIPFGKE